MVNYHEEVSFSVSCQTRARKLIDIYPVPQSWLSKPKFAVSGIIYRSTPNEADGEKEFFELETSGDKRFSKVKQVSKDDIVASFEGNWRGEIKWKKAGESVSDQSISCIDSLQKLIKLPCIELANSDRPRTAESFPQDRRSS